MSPSDISRTARLRHVDLILMGFHNPVYTQSILGGTVHRVFDRQRHRCRHFRRNAEHPIRGVFWSPSWAASTIDWRWNSPAEWRGTPACQSPSFTSSPPAGTRASMRCTPRPPPTASSAIPPNRCPFSIRIVEANSPVDVVVEQSKQFDLIVIGRGGRVGT